MDKQEILYLRKEYQNILSIPKGSAFLRPLLIYDDKCSSCGQFALWARRLSGGWIRLAGHYNSPEAIKVKKAIFAEDYDSTQMFWLINRNGAFGARSGLKEVFKEIIRGIFKTRLRGNFLNDRPEYNLPGDDVTAFKYHTCDHLTESKCATMGDTWTRIIRMLRNSDIYRHSKE